MTLIELMIVVAIIGVLASLAVFMFNRSKRNALASEVPAVFAEFRIRQEGFHLENGSYNPTNSTNVETVWFPATPAIPKDGATDITGSMPTEWRQLRFSSDKNALYCSYVNIAGAPADNPQAIAQGFGFDSTTKPPTNWFYMLAFCDLDGSGGNYSTYFARIGADGQAVQNPGN